MKDYTEFLVGPLQVPIGGKLYTIPPVDIATGLLLRRLLDPTDLEAQAELAGETAEDGYRRILGATYDEMKADGVAWDALDRTYLTAVTDHQRGRLVAETVWEMGHDPKAIMALISSAARIATSGVVQANTTPRPSSGKTTRTSRGAKQKRGTRRAGKSTGRR